MNLHELAPGALAEHADRAMMEVFGLDACRLQLEHFTASGDPVHLQRAYRIARAFGELSPAFLQLLQPHLDAWLGEPVKSTKRADQRQKRAALLLAYYHEMRRMEREQPGHATSKDEIYARVAKLMDTTAGAVEQQVLTHEGRDRTRNS
jgi:hypothetical protein